LSVFLFQNVYAVVDLHGQVEAVSTTSTVGISMMQSSNCAVTADAETIQDAESSRQDDVSIETSDHLDADDVEEARCS
jgi:hypothetical protein